ncbi:MAG: c-type cytochrome [Alphaproteobacteria bacterium]|nr:c-type cytochrome [Alphaproteobacteria bacterium]
MKETIAAGVSIALVLAAGTVAAQSGNEARGERVFNQQCKICHAVEKADASAVGPNLAGLFGRKAGTAPGFEASDAMKASGIVWDDKTLADYLKDPQARLLGTTMVFNGLKQAAQLADVIAYLRKATQ